MYYSAIQRPASQTDTTQKRNCSFCSILISEYRTAQFTTDTTLINIEFDTGLLFGGQTIMLTRKMRQRTPKPKWFVSENKSAKSDDVATEDAPPIFSAQWREYFEKKTHTHSFVFYYYYFFHIRADGRFAAGFPECICNRPRPWSRPCVSDWGCGAVILLSRGEFGREKNKICYQRGCVWTFCYVPNL